MNKKFLRGLRGKTAKEKTGGGEKNGKMETSGMKKKYLKGGQSCKVTFSLPKGAVDGAGSVTVAGDFNFWDVNATPLKKHKTGGFSTTVELASGRTYRFRYLIDGIRWENDWYADGYEPNPYGQDDSLVVV